MAPADQPKYDLFSRPGRRIFKVSQLTAEAIAEILARTSKPHSMAEYQHLLSLRDGIGYANSAIGVLVLVWWIVCLWKNEPDATTPAAASPSGAVSALPEPGATLSQPE